MKKYKVSLTAEEREDLQKMVRTGKGAAQRIGRARVLLKADDGWKDEDITKALEVSIRTVERVRLDNAVLMSRRVYLTDLDAFDAVLAANGRDLRRTVAGIITEAKADDSADSFDAVKRLTGLRVPPLAH